MLYPNIKNLVIHLFVHYNRIIEYSLCLEKITKLVFTILMLSFHVSQYKYIAFNVDCNSVADSYIDYSWNWHFARVIALDFCLFFFILKGNECIIF